MPQRTRWIISQRMAGVKMDEIGTALGISESRVSQILFEIRPELERVLVGR
jgi:DNA-directed RNA polymerase specialized sigma subunit